MPDLRSSFTLRNLALLMLLVFASSFLASCVVRTHSHRPPPRQCRTDCHWDHGRRVCHERCR